MKKRTYEILEQGKPGDRAHLIFLAFLVLLISLNAVALVVSTVERIYNLSPMFFKGFEGVSVAIFTLEYLLRVWACTEDPRYASSISGRLRFILSPLLIIDLIAIAPFYATILGATQVVDLRFLRAIRLFARLARLGRYFSGIRTLSRVVQAKRGELGTVVLVLGLLLLLASSTIFFAEHRAQPDAFSSIPAAMWWTIVTLTTVGYGDMFPVTSIGRVVAGVIAILGIGLFALPAGILGAGFLEEIQNRRLGPRRCPHCGEELPE